MTGQRPAPGKSECGQPRCWLSWSQVWPLNALQCFACLVRIELESDSIYRSIRSRWGYSQSARCHALARERAAASLHREDLIAVWSVNTRAATKGPRGARVPNPSLLWRVSAGSWQGNSPPPGGRVMELPIKVVSTIPTRGLAAHGGKSPGAPNC